MIEDEVTECLRDLVDLVGAAGASIVAESSGPPSSESSARTTPLGAGEFLRLDLSTCKPGIDVDAALDQAMRRLRAIRRRWEVAHLPEIAVSAPTHRAIGASALERIQEYLRALAAVDRGSNALLLRHTELVAAARVPNEVEAARWPLIARRIMSIRSPHSSHGELADPDAFAMSFWYDAGLILLLDEPYAVDFVRHRCRQVARELCHLLPLLEPDPGAPAAMGPRSPTHSEG